MIAVGFGERDPDVGRRFGTMGSPTGSLLTERSFHAAALLPSRKPWRGAPCTRRRASHPIKNSSQRPRAPKTEERHWQALSNTTRRLKPGRRQEGSGCRGRSTRRRCFLSATCWFPAALL